jgi:prepilin-type processing-associated H-X9-DG protein
MASETMEEQFLGYLLNALDECGMREVEAHLQAHPEARRKLTLLKQALDPLVADQEAPSPPPQLAERTLAKVAEQICSAGGRISDLPKAPPIAPRSISGGRSWWRRADVMVAASLLITAVGIALVVLGRMRGPSSADSIIACKNNLREFFGSLQEYRDAHGRFPDVAKESPHDVAGMVVPILNEAGTLSENTSIRCPGIGSSLSCPFTVSVLSKMSDAEFALHSPTLSMCYAYSLGYREGETIHGPGDGSETAFSQTPIMADRPPAEGIQSNSINHGGKGQNVLFADGQVRFLTGRALGADLDIFLNRDNIVAAGLDAADIVLGYSAARAQP